MGSVRPESTAVKRVDYVSDSEIPQSSHSVLRPLGTAWLMESIVPRHRRNRFLTLADRIRNPRIPVHINVRSIAAAATEIVRDALLTAIDVDDDILTQGVEGAELKQQIRNADAFDAFVQLLRHARAIDI